MLNKKLTPGGGRNQGGGTGRKSSRGRMGGNRSGAGPGGNCLCPNCGTKIPHKQGEPCFNAVCPRCRTQMMRE